MTKNENTKIACTHVSRDYADAALGRMLRLTEETRADRRRRRTLRALPSQARRRVERLLLDARRFGADLVSP